MLLFCKVRFVTKQSIAPLAQLVEQLPFKETVAGSNPARGTVSVRAPMKKYLNILLSSLALCAAGALAISHFEYEGPHTLLFVALALIAGYQFGRWTCHLLTKQSGLWITILVFVVLNFLHSLIDGAAIGDLRSFFQGTAVLSHELARQPALYIVLGGMLTPFMFTRYHRVLIAFFAVTGISILGIVIGQKLSLHLTDISWLHPLAEYAVFLFIGDIIHHIRDERQKLRQRTASVL